MTMDPLAAEISYRCSGPEFRTLGSLTRSAKGLAARAAVRARIKRGSTIYPYLSAVRSVHYFVAGGEIFPIDMAGREKQALFFQREPKVILQRRIQADRFRAGYVEDRLAVGRDFFILTGRSLHIDAMYLLGLLGSRLYTFLYLESHSITYAGETKRIRLQELRKLPIPIHRPVERGLIIGLVMRILNAKARDSTADTTALEQEVDTLVYRLFGLTEEEVAHVEGGSARYRELFSTLPERGTREWHLIAGTDPLPDAVG